MIIKALALAQMSLSSNFKLMLSVEVKVCVFTTSTKFPLTKSSNRKRRHIFDLSPPVFAHPSVPAASVSVHASLVRRRTLVWIAAKRHFSGLQKDLSFQTDSLFKFCFITMKKSNVQ